MTEYRRCRIKGGCYFFTVNLADRKQTLLTEKIELLRESFRVVKEHHPFDIEAIVILPEHLHTIWTLPEGDDVISVAVGGRSRRILAGILRKVSGFPKAAGANRNVEFGKGDFGSIKFETSVISLRMPITFIMCDVKSHPLLFHLERGSETRCSLNDSLPMQAKLVTAWIEAIGTM